MVNILVVEDDVKLNQIVCSYLNNSGFVAKGCLNAEDAYEQIGYADALVSMLSLQTAMFVSFGTEEQVNRKIMNSMTGVVVCMMIFMMGVYMIFSALKQKKKLFKNL